MFCQIVQKKQEEKRIEEEQAAKARYWKILACCDDDDDYDSAITPILSTKEPVDSLSMGDEHLDTIPAMESDEVIKSSVENLVPIPSEFEGISDTMCDVHFVNNPTPIEAKDHVEIVINSNDDISSSDDHSLHEENIDIEALKDNPTQSSEPLTKSSSTPLNSFLEETNTFHNSFPEFENFYFDLGEISNGSTTTHSDISLTVLLQETLKRRWRYLVPAESHIHNHMLIPEYQDNKYQDFRYSDELSNLERYEHVSPMSLEHKLISSLFSSFPLLCDCEITNPSKDNPTPYSDFMTKSSSTSLNFLLEETITFDNSLPESETFCFDLEEISSGCTTTRSDISLPDYEAFYDNHVKEISSVSTTTHSDFSLYDSFIFDLLINPFPPADRSDFYHEEFADELAHIISPPEYDCFCFKNEPSSGDFTMDVVEDTFPTREPRVHVHNVLPTHPTLQLNMDFILSSESLFAYVVWIFLPFLSYSVAPQYLLSFRNEDTIFDPGISSYHISSFMTDVSLRSGTFMKFNVYPKHLNGSTMEILFSTCSSMDQ
nr:hypothetical protein [Tanacetum cinerariifolium]